MGVFKQASNRTVNQANGLYHKRAKSAEKILQLTRIVLYSPANAIVYVWSKQLDTLKYSSFPYLKLECSLYVS